MDNFIEPTPEDRQRVGKLKVLGRAVLLAMSLWLVVMVTHVAHSSLSLPCECKDFLSVLQVKPPHVLFVKCEPETHRQGKPLKASYRVSGAHAVEAEAFFVRLAKMPQIKKSCCQWDGPPGQFTGKDGRIYSVYMTSAETTVKNREQWRDIVSFEIVVETLTEEI